MASAVTIPPNMDTTLYRRNVLQGLKALNFDPTGRLQVDSLTASSADLTIIENLQIQSNALLTSQLNELIQIALNTSGGGGGGGLVTVTNFPSSQAVTNAGTFAVQNTDPTPAGTNTIGAVNIASSQTIAVTQATASNLNATITGTVTANAGTNLSTSNLDVALSTRLKPADTLAGVTAVGSITNALPAGTNTIGAVTVTGVATAANQATEITSLASIATNTAKVAGFSIPTFDTKTFTYVSGTTNIQTVVYSLSGTTVATLTFNYTSGNLTSIVKS